MYREPNGVNGHKRTRLRSTARSYPMVMITTGCPGFLHEQCIYNEFYLTSSINYNRTLSHKSRLQDLSESSQYLFGETWGKRTQNSPMSFETFIHSLCCFYRLWSFSNKSPVLQNHSQAPLSPFIFPQDVVYFLLCTELVHISFCYAVPCNDSFPLLYSIGAVNESSALKRISTPSAPF